MKAFLSLAVLFVSMTVCTASLSQFAGDWTNVDTNNRGNNCPEYRHLWQLRQCACLGQMPSHRL